MSNMVTYYTNGDCSLSITMTTLSTLMAFGMMPSNLWLYTRTWTKGTTVSIPYKGILVSLLLILIPVAAGYLFVLKYPNMRSVVAKTGSFSGMLAIVISMILFFFMNYNLMQMLSIDICIATATMPIIGFCFGYALSALFCLTQKQKRTVGFETGCQNASIAFSVISMSFPADVLSHFLLVPLLFCLFSFIEGWLFVVTWQAVKTLRGKCKVWREEGCVGFEESSDEEDGGRERGRRREPDEKLKATVASLTQSALEWKLRRQQSSGSSKHASRNNSAANLHHGGGAPAHTMHGSQGHLQGQSQCQVHQQQQQQHTTSAMAMPTAHMLPNTPTAITMTVPSAAPSNSASNCNSNTVNATAAAAATGTAGGMFLVDHTKSTQV